MSDERDIVERLNETVGWASEPDTHEVILIAEAASEITRLRGEVERLREALDELLFENSNKTEVERLVTRLKARDALSSAPKPEEG